MKIERSLGRREDRRRIIRTLFERGNLVRIPSWEVGTFVVPFLVEKAIIMVS